MLLLLVREPHFTRPQFWRLPRSQLGLVCAATYGTRGPGKGHGSSFRREMNNPRRVQYFGLKRREKATVTNRPPSFSCSNSKRLFLAPTIPPSRAVGGLGSTQSLGGPTSRKLCRPADVPSEGVAPSTAGGGGVLEGPHLLFTISCGSSTHPFRFLMLRSELAPWPNSRRDQKVPPCQEGGKNRPVNPSNSQQMEGQDSQQSKGRPGSSVLSSCLPLSTPLRPLSPSPNLT